MTVGLQRPLVSENLAHGIAGVPKGVTYLEEAEFGLRRILPMIAALPDGARVLEIGSGPCILLSELAKRYPRLHLEGVEPMADGFAHFDAFMQRMRGSDTQFALHRGGYESFGTDREWDFVFLVNVFEHLPDWRNFLAFVSRILSINGKCVVLCPNYGFPYESHFRMPVLWNKSFTEVAFRQRIARLEREMDTEGLFRSLNFVTLRQVRRAAPKAGLLLKVDTSIIEEMIDRLDADPHFRQRQAWLAPIAGSLKRTGLLSTLLDSAMAQDFLPYMQLEFTRTSAP